MATGKKEFIICDVAKVEFDDTGVLTDNERYDEAGIIAVPIENTQKDR